MNLYCWSLEVDGEYLYLGTFDASFILKYIPPDIDLNNNGTPDVEELIEALNQMKEGLTNEERAFIHELIQEAFKAGYLTLEQALSFERLFVDENHEITYEDIELFIQLFAGADLWKSEDGLIWKPVTLNGFDNINNYGFRTMKYSPNTLYAGASNPFQGCEVWRAPPRPEPVGGEIAPTNTLTLMAPWIILAITAITAITVGYTLTRKKIFCTNHFS